MGLYYDSAKGWQLTNEKTDYRTDYRTDFPTNLTRKETYTVKKCGGWWPFRRCWKERRTRTVEDTKKNRENQIKNATNKANNDENRKLNEKNTALNTAYQTTLTAANRTKGGDYVSKRDLIRNVGNVDQNVLNQLENDYKTFYRKEKLQTWDVSKGAKPPYGAFDPKYYGNTNPSVANTWKTAVANDDIDITERYGSEGGYYLGHYTNQGKAAGNRGNAAEELTAAKIYSEKPTDKDFEDIRTVQLGVDTGSQADRLLRVPEVAAQWEKAKRDDPYWEKLAKENFLDVNKKDDFVALFRLSQREEDKDIKFKYAMEAGQPTGITDLEDAISTAVGSKALVDVKKFGALTQDVLKETIKEMNKAREQEQMLDLYKGFSGFSEITGINQTLTESILGDTGVGGILSFTGGGKAEESLEKSLQNITGVQNEATYNWQQWFDNTLKERYQDDLELGYTVDDVEQKIKIEGDFARQFIDDYLIPRFNTSRSMDEFVEYLDVRQEEQNPFQTQDIVNATSQVADIRARKYLDDLRGESARSFDSAFYFNPTGDAGRAARYAEQSKVVNEDWEKFQKKDSYWTQQAYRFGVGPNDKDGFARMHFQLVGQHFKDKNGDATPFDPAEDIVNASKVKDEIYNNILPALEKEALAQGSVFGQFITPEEFADEVLKGLDPEDDEEYQKVLKQYGLDDFAGSVDELKEYIVESLRTGSAQQIRENIKYLNEKRQDPTQAKLGITYIDRPEDFKDEQAKPDTELYKVFQKAGYQGTEDDFYTKFFPDLERSEQQLLTVGGRDEALKTTGLDFSDPFASLGTIQGFFEDDEENQIDTDRSGTKKDKSYFSLNLDDDDDEEYKSKRGQEILGEFTSMFKGF